MTALNCMLRVMDNSGAKVAKLIGIQKKARKKLAVGDIIRVSIIESISKNVPEGSKRYAIVCCLKSGSHRKNSIYSKLGGLFVRSSQNGIAILTDDKKKWAGTAVKGFVADEVRAKFPEIISKALGVF